MELRDYMRVLRRGWAVVLAFVVLGLAGGIGITLATTREYRASVQIFVALTGAGDAAQLVQGNTFTQDRVQSYTSIATSPAVTGAVISRLHLGLTEQQLAEAISADAPQNTVLIDLYVTDPNPDTAAALANAVAAQFGKVVQATEQTDANGRPAVKLTVIHPATPPASPVKPNKTLNIGLGLVIGLIIGVGVVVLRDVLDNTVKGPSDFAELDVPVLGMVPLDKRSQRTPIAFREDPHSVRAEAYRQLRTNLQFVNVDQAPRVIAITSAVPREGKSTTAMNLAAALAEAGNRVCLVEADLRRPTLAKTLGLVGEVGFTSVIIGKITLEDALQNAGRNLAVLTSGPVPPNPSELLLTGQARAVIQAVSELVDYTIIDTAPLLPVADAVQVASIADATLIVHHAGKTTREQAARSVEALAKVGKRPVGVILNMVTRASGRYDYEYNYYYTYRPDHARGGPAEATAENTPPPTTPAAQPTHPAAPAANGHAVRASSHLPESSPAARSEALASQPPETS